MKRNGSLLFVGIFLLAAIESYAASPAKPAPPALDWHDVTTWGVEGRACTDMERSRWFDRLPAEAEAKVTKSVWSLSRDSAGRRLARCAVSEQGVQVGPNVRATG